MRTSPALDRTSGGEGVVHIGLPAHSESVTWRVDRVAGVAGAAGAGEGVTPVGAGEGFPSAGAGVVSNC